MWLDAGTIPDRLTVGDGYWGVDRTKLGRFVSKANASPFTGPYQPLLMIFCENLVHDSQESSLEEGDIQGEAF